MADSKAERICGLALQSLLPAFKFKKIRPAEFVNPSTGYPLELDFYCAELKLAVEYNGAQHYKYTPKFHRSISAFQKQKTRDLIKENYCQIYGIKLIEVPALQTYDDISQYISASLKQLGVTDELEMRDYAFIQYLLSKPAWYLPGSPTDPETIFEQYAKYHSHYPNNRCAFWNTVLSFGIVKVVSGGYVLNDI